MNALYGHVTFDLEVRDFAWSKSMLIMAHVMFVKFDQKVSVMIHNPETKSVSNTQSVFVSFLFLPASAEHGIKNDGMLREMFKARVEMECNVATGGHQVYSKALFVAAEDGAVDHDFSIGAQAASNVVTKGNGRTFDCVHFSVS